MRPIFTKFFSLFCFLFFSFHYAYSQCDLPCNDLLVIEPAYECEEALNSAFNGDGHGFVCNMNGFCSQNLDVPVKNPPPVFCNAGACVLNNPIWFSFVASSSILDIDVCPYNCQGAGLQWALYDQCNNLLNSVACWCTPSLPGDVLFNILANVNPGTTYYLVIDGSNGSTCGTKFRVNSGIQYTLVGDLISDVLTGPNPVCKGNIATYTSLGFHHATAYIWTLDGETVATDALSVSLDIYDLALGDHTLCLKGTNVCSDGLWKEKCWNFKVKPNVEIDKLGQVCEDNPIGFPFRGNYYLPGEYEITAPVGDGLSCDSIYHLTVNKLLKSESPQIDVVGKVCEDNPSGFLFKKNYYQPGSYDIPVPAEDGISCDSIFHLTVKKILNSESPQVEVSGIVCKDNSVGFLFRGNFYVPGIYDIKAPAGDGNSCDTTFHLTVEELPNPGVDFLGSVCENNPTGYLFKGVYYSPGTYDVKVPVGDGISCDTIFHLLVKKLLRSEGPEIKLGKCEEDSTIIYQGSPYSTFSPFHELHYSNFNGCDSLVKLYVNDLSVAGSLNAEPEKIPTGGGSVVLALEYVVNLIAPEYTSSVIWSDSAFNQIGADTNEITISKPGTYYAELTVTIDNPDGVADEVCSRIYSVTVDMEHGTSVGQDLSKIEFLCESKMVNDFLIIEKNGSSKNYEVNIIDISGKVIMRNVVFINTWLKIPLGSFPPGMYFYQIMNGPQQVCLGKFIKQ